MVTINANDIKDLKELVSQYKKYKALYDTTMSMFDPKLDYYASSDIRDAIKTSMYRVLDRITHSLSHLYIVWSGKIDLHPEDFENEAELYEALDIIDCNNENIAGECDDIVGIESELYVPLHIPTNFIQDFMADYGIFALDSNNDVYIP